MNTLLSQGKDRYKERLNVIFIFWKCIWEIRSDNPSLAVKILNDTPRPNVPSQKAWLEIASDNHSRIFTRERERERVSLMHKLFNWKFISFLIPRSFFHGGIINSLLMSGNANPQIMPEWILKRLLQMEIIDDSVECLKVI